MRVIFYPFKSKYDIYEICLIKFLWVITKVLALKYKKDLNLGNSKTLNTILRSKITLKHKENILYFFN